MARLGHSDVQSQVARGIANFAKCESQQVVQGETLFFFSSSQGLLKYGSSSIIKFAMKGDESCSFEYKGSNSIVKWGSYKFWVKVIMLGLHFNGLFILEFSMKEN